MNARKLLLCSESQNCQLLVIIFKLIKIDSRLLTILKFKLIIVVSTEIVKITANYTIKIAFTNLRVNTSC